MPHMSNLPWLEIYMMANFMFLMLTTYSHNNKSAVPLLSNNVPNKNLLNWQW